MNHPKRRRALERRELVYKLDECRELGFAVPEQLESLDVDQLRAMLKALTAEMQEMHARQERASQIALATRIHQRAITANCKSEPFASIAAADVNALSAMGLSQIKELNVTWLMMVLAPAAQ